METFGCALCPTMSAQGSSLCESKRSPWYYLKSEGGRWCVTTEGVHFLLSESCPLLSNLAGIGTLPLGIKTDHWGLCREKPAELIDPFILKSSDKIFHSGMKWSRLETLLLVDMGWYHTSLVLTLPCLWQI